MPLRTYRFIQSMRWFGPSDPVGLDDLLQAGCTGVVTALHHIPNGEVWSREEIMKRKREVESKGLSWSVVESVPVHESIKQRKDDCETFIANYCETIRNLAACGITVVAYNFMPVVDWTRTDLSFPLRDGSTALRFDLTELAAFDMFILQRTDAEKAYPAVIVESARLRYQGMGKGKIEALQNNIIAGLPGSEEGYTLHQFRDALSNYKNIDETALRNNLLHFLQKIVPAAEECGIFMALHPDDPPFSILGLPRAVKNSWDLDALFQAIPSRSNGLCMCTGSFGVDASNDLPAMAARYAERIHFVHLRNIRRETDGSFYEDDHLAGDVDMYRVMKALVDIMHVRERDLPMRPDHGHQMLDDLKKKVNPGYSAIGRLRGLAELRGLEMGIARNIHS